MGCQRIVITRHGTARDDTKQAVYLAGSRRPGTKAIEQADIPGSTPRLEQGHPPR